MRRDGGRFYGRRVATQSLKPRRVECHVTRFAAEAAASRVTDKGAFRSCFSGVLRGFPASFVDFRRIHVMHSQGLLSNLRRGPNANSSAHFCVQTSLCTCVCGSNDVSRGVSAEQTTLFASSSMRNDTPTCMRARNLTPPYTWPEVSSCLVALCRQVRGGHEAPGRGGFQPQSQRRQPEVHVGHVQGATHVTCHVTSRHVHLTFLAAIRGRARPRGRPRWVHAWAEMILGSLTEAESGWGVRLWFRPALDSVRLSRAKGKCWRGGGFSGSAQTWFAVLRPILFAFSEQAEGSDAGQHATRVRAPLHRQARADLRQQRGHGRGQQQHARPKRTLGSVCARFPCKHAPSWGN